MLQLTDFKINLSLKHHCFVTQSVSVTYNQQSIRDLRVDLSAQRKPTATGQGKEHCIIMNI